MTPTAGVRQRGFTYLWLIFVLAAGAAAAAAIGQRTSVAVQREHEAELLFRGQEIAQALSRYRAATPGAIKRLPTSLQDLVEDKRGLRTLHHLRRVYADPFTGHNDWVVLTTEDGRIWGVHSRARTPALRTKDLPAPSPGEPSRVCDWIFRFVELPHATNPDGAASAPSS